MQIAALDWAIIVGYLLFALGVGVLFARRAGRDVDEFFLSGRSLPWWVAGTSMVATTFASDTPLVITGWVRDLGIWQNWLWWTFAAGGMLTVFLFARYWRRGEVMTTAELAELRYGGVEAKVLRGFLGVYQAAITNTIILCWVILAAAKIMDVLFDVDKTVAVALACLLALSYSMLAGFWGVVVTDVVQFAMAMVGAVALAWFSWEAVGGAEGVLEHAAKGSPGFTNETLAFFPVAGEGGFFDPSFWTVNLATICVLLGVQWWAYELVDGGSLAVQRISASRTERDGVLAALWYNIAHYALRPWPWILVALASLILLPPIDVRAPFAGTVTATSSTKGAEHIVLAPDDGADEVTIQLAEHALADDWAPTQILVTPGTEAHVSSGEVIARADSERAYVVMMKRLLPTGLLGLAIASLLAAFMSTVDTHVNLASSFFVNDVYRRFLRRDASERHYVRAARVSSAGVLAIAGVLAWNSKSIGQLFTFFLAFLSGVGPIYILRWLWWRVRASTEIVAMLTSSLAATWLTYGKSIAAFCADFFGYDGLVSLAAYEWQLGRLSVDGELTTAGRLCLVVGFSGTLSLISLLLLPRPKPVRLVQFYKQVQPVGFWGPVRALCPEVRPPREARPILLGALGGLGMIYGLLFGIGGWLLERRVFTTVWLAVAVIGLLVVTWAFAQLRPSTDVQPSRSTSAST